MSMPKYEARFMEILMYAPHLNIEKLQAKKFVYGLNYNIRSMFQILVPHTFHEVL